MQLYFSGYYYCFTAGVITPALSRSIVDSVALWSDLCNLTPGKLEDIVRIAFTPLLHAFSYLFLEGRDVGMEAYST